MFGWFSEARTLASRSKRASRSGSRASASGKTLIATARSSFTSRARYTSPMPPAPSGAWISYGPKFVPELRVIRRCGLYPQRQPLRLLRFLRGFDFAGGPSFLLREGRGFCFDGVLSSACVHCQVARRRSLRAQNDSEL